MLYALLNLLKMSDEAAIPTLPAYAPPIERVPAALPKGLEVTKMPSTMNKLISRMMPKLKAKLPKMKMKAAVKPRTKSRMTTKTKKGGISIVS